MVNRILQDIDVSTLYRTFVGEESIGRLWVVKRRDADDGFNPFDPDAPSPFVIVWSGEAFGIKLIDEKTGEERESIGEVRFDSYRIVVNPQDTATIEEGFFAFVKRSHPQYPGSDLMFRGVIVRRDRKLSKRLILRVDTSQQNVPLWEEVPIDA